MSDRFANGNPNNDSDKSVTEKPKEAIQVEDTAAILKELSRI